MRRTIFILVLGLVSAFAAGAQDRIYFNDGRTTDVIVDEVGDSYIYYRLYGNPDGPLCTASTFNVLRIVYENGTQQTFAGGAFYDDRTMALLGDVPLTMRFDNGNLYLGSRDRFGLRRADYVAFNLYGDEYYAARRNRRWGGSLIWVGSMSAIWGVALLFCYVPEGGALLSGVGAACLGTGIPLLIKGNNRLKSIANDYNSRMSDGNSLQLTLGPCRNGFGLALNF